MNKTAVRPPCKRCEGVGHTDIDILPGVPEEPCHRCAGQKYEPYWAMSEAAGEMEFRRLATADGMDLAFQDLFAEAIYGKRP